MLCFFVCYWSIFFYTTKISYASFSSSFGWTNCHLTEFSYYFHTINFDQEAFVSLYYNDTWKAVGWRSMYKKPQLEQQRCQQQPKTLALCRACKQFSVAVVASWNTTHCCTQCWWTVLKAACARFCCSAAGSAECCYWIEQEGSSAKKFRRNDLLRSSRNLLLSTVVQSKNCSVFILSLFWMAHNLKKELLKISNLLSHNT